MAAEIDRARRDGAMEFSFDCLLGGINVDSTRPVSDFARARLAGIWRNVAEVTGARFGAGLPGGDFVYSSVAACIACEAMRDVTGAPPFEYLHRLQQLFFGEAVDVTNEAVLLREAAALGVDIRRFEAAFRAAETRRRVLDGFAIAKSYGTAALPSVLLSVEGGRRLVAGGYVDAPTLLDAAHGVLAR